MKGVHIVNHKTLLQFYTYFLSTYRSLVTLQQLDCAKLPLLHQQDTSSQKKTLSQSCIFYTKFTFLDKVAHFWKCFPSSQKCLFCAKVTLVSFMQNDTYKSKMHLLLKNDTASQRCLFYANLQILQKKLLLFTQFYSPIEILKYFSYCV